MVAICYSCSTDDSVYLDVNQQNESSFLNRPAPVCEGGYTPGDTVIFDYEMKVTYISELTDFEKAVKRLYYTQHYAYNSLNIIVASKKANYDEIWEYQISYGVDVNGCLIETLPSGPEAEAGGDPDIGCFGCL